MRAEPRYHDTAREQWNTRMAWSMMAAVATHAAILASWPVWGEEGASSDPVAELAQPEWFFLDQPREPGPEEGPGGAEPRLASGAIPVEPDAGRRVALTQEDLEALSEALRDRLIRSASFSPTVAGPELDGMGIDPRSMVVEASTVAEDSSRAGGRSSTARLSAADFQALQGLSALDLERLSAIRPEVALEASSNWVLVRNPARVLDFMLRNATPIEDGGGEKGSVSVALWVSAEGAVEWAEIITSSGRSDWDSTALTLFSEVVAFRPARLEGVPMPMSAIFTVNFPWF